MVKESIEVVKASDKVKGGYIQLSEIMPKKESYTTHITNPFKVPLEERIDFYLPVMKILRKESVIKLAKEKKRSLGLIPVVIF